MKPKVAVRRCFVVAAVIVLCPLSGSAAAATNCGNGPSHPGKRESAIVDLRASGTSCRQARKVSGRFRDLRRGVLGYSCRSRPAEGVTHVTCSKRAVRVRFTLVVF